LKLNTVIGIIIIILAVIAALISAILSQQGALGPSALISNVPLNNLPEYVNPPPKEIPHEISCNWFVICGKYVILEEYGVFKAGDYIEIDELGIAHMSGDREVYRGTRIHEGSPLNPACYPRSGKWRAERIPILNDPTHYSHRVTLQLSSDECGLILRPFKCTVEISDRSHGSAVRSQLVCDDVQQVGGGTWALCGNHGTTEEIKKYCSAANLANKSEFIVLRIPPGSLSRNANFEPSSINLTRGNTLTILNEDQAWCTLLITKMSSPLEKKPVVLQALLSAGGEANVTLYEPGEYLLHTEPWPWMKATVVVR